MRKVSMKLVMLTGFLGSGKTSILLDLMRGLTSDGEHRFVILENEVGEIGIDGPFLEAEGLRVRELFSGCICCQLAADLVTTLHEIQDVLDPDGVFLEASGMARPKNILETLGRYCKVVDEVMVLTVVDAARYDTLIEAGIPLINLQIEPAQVVVINKIDLVSKEDTSKLTAQVARMNSTADIYQVSTLKGTDLNPLLERVRTLWT
jgi:G3E family GTPase